MGLELYIWFWSKKIKFSFFLTSEGTYPENCFSRIEDLPLGFHLKILYNWGQYSYGFRTICSSLSDAFFDRSESFYKLAKKSRMHHMMTFICEFLLRFSRKDVSRIFRVIIKFFKIDPKNCEFFKWRHLFENFCKYFSEGRRQENFSFSAYDHRCKII